jgi:hypothetical protein
MLGCLIRLALLIFVISVVVRLSLLAFHLDAHKWQLGKLPRRIGVVPPCSKVMVHGSHKPNRSTRSNGQRRCLATSPPASARVHGAEASVLWAPDALN